MPERRRLIVNADDFGFNRDVNAGIIEAHRGGVLTATTLMANGDAFDDAVALARRTPTLDIGCHLVLVQGRSVLDPSRELPATLKELLRSLAHREIPVYEEASAQVRKLVAAGIRPSHIDSHKHSHLLPPVLEAVARVAREYQIPWVRRPFDFGTGSLLKRVVSTGMKVMSPRFATTLQGLRTTEHFTGFLVTGVLTDSKFAEILERLPPGLTEFMCHPGRLGSELSTAATRLKESREVELAALLSPLVRKAIEQHGIELTNFRDA
jgi:chitin disaccharide deacetylase